MPTRLSSHDSRWGGGAPESGEAPSAGPQLGGIYLIFTSGRALPGFLHLAVARRIYMQASPGAESSAQKRAKEQQEQQDEARRPKGVKGKEEQRDEASALERGIQA